jgi:2-polyprenyl-3-methyl-5-hydroxy-6-metoxy-1,4-benzoquinol methylase
LPDATFVQRDISLPHSLDDLGPFDLVVSLAVLQHIPGRSNRIRMLEEMGRRLKPDGRLFLSTWQFMQSPRQRRKVVPWSTIGLSDQKVERNDYLLDWRSGGRGLRYVAYVDESELMRLAHEASLSIVETFRSDGREGDLNLYVILQRTDTLRPGRVPLEDDVAPGVGKLT